MPKGVPVGTFAIGKAGAANAALFAASIIAKKKPEIGQKLKEWRAARAQEVLKNSVLSA
jgi:5-(carboxyamino)imidazole ribonucleotide mutase